MVGHEDALSGALLGLAVLLDGTDRSVLINTEIRQGSQFDILVDMLLGLWGGIDLLLFLLLSSLDRDKGVEIPELGVQGQTLEDLEFLGG